MIGWVFSFFNQKLKSRFWRNCSFVIVEACSRDMQLESAWLLGWLMMMRMMMLIIPLGVRDDDDADDVETIDYFHSFMAHNHNCDRFEHIGPVVGPRRQPPLLLWHGDVASKAVYQMYRLARRAVRNWSYPRNWPATPKVWLAAWAPHLNSDA